VAVVRARQKAAILLRRDLAALDRRSRDEESTQIGDHTLFSIMTTEPNAVVEPIHEKAMPVMLMTPDDVEQWLRGVSVDDALKMQKPAPDDAIVIRPEEKKAAERQVGNVKNNRPELMERVGLL
jgi:putative SOS response-associated peptidase YedK